MEIKKHFALYENEVGVTQVFDDIILIFSL